MLDGGDEETIKVIIVGDGFAGKTSLLRRFVRGDFTDQYKKTIGAEFLEKDVYLRDSSMTVKLMLWDTAGQEVFNALTQAYYRGAGAAILVFSTVDRESFVNVARWKERVEAVCGPITMVLCQSKFDLSHEAAITNEEAEGLAKYFKIPFYRVSSRDDFNVTQLFEFTAQQCLRAVEEEEGSRMESENGNIARDPVPPSVPLQEDSKNLPSSTAVASPEPTATVSEAAAATPERVPEDAAGGRANADAPPPAIAAPGASPAAPTNPSTAAEVVNNESPQKKDPQHHHKHKGVTADDSRKVTLKEPAAVAAAQGGEDTGKKKKKKKRCTLL